MQKIVYIADLDQDIDDLIAAEYLNQKGVLKCIVMDPIPKTKEGIERKQMLSDLGIEIRTKMIPDAEIVFVGGALTTISSYIINHKIKYLVMNGGFVGNNIVKEPLKKFKDKTECRTFNFNCDVQSTDKVLKSKNIENIILVGKNVCHDKRNTPIGIWKDEKELFKKYNVNDTKLQHDMLACHEGLVELGLIEEEHFLDYQMLQPYNLGLNGSYTLWGSKEKDDKNQYRMVKAAIKWK